MDLRTKPKKSKTESKRPGTRKSPKDPVAKLQEKNQALTEALKREAEALEQQTATSDILRTIAHTQTDVQPVFDAIVRSAQRLLHTHSAALRRLVGEDLIAAAYTTTTFEGEHLAPPRASFSIHSFPGTAARQRAASVVADMLTDPRMPEEGRDTARRRGYRSMLSIPLLREHHVLGLINVTRRDPGGFTDDEIALLQTFADQAVIAIENVRLFKELEAANRGLAAASQHKSEFLANMSHELRTPLNAIIGYSELLEEEAEDLDGARLVPDLQKIATAAKHQLSLINDILDLSKVEAGRMELEPSDFDLPSAIENALTLVHERATRRGIVLGRMIDDRVGVIQGDERKVKQVLLNLFSNALKFTPEGGRIDVGATLNGAMAEVSVSDTGMGIALEDQEAVFEQFRQVGTADKKVEGTGLGPALCRTL